MYRRSFDRGCLIYKSTSKSCCRVPAGAVTGTPELCNFPDLFLSCELKKKNTFWVTMIMKRKKKFPKGSLSNHNATGRVRIYTTNVRRFLGSQIFNVVYFSHIFGTENHQLAFIRSHTLFLFFCDREILRSVKYPNIFFIFTKFRTSFTLVRDFFYVKLQLHTFSSNELFFHKQ